MNACNFNREVCFSLFCVVWLGSMLCLPTLSRAAENVITCPTNQDTPVQYGDIVKCSIEVVGDSDVFRFSGNAGETIIVQTAIRSGTGNPFAQLFDPDGINIGQGLNPFQVTMGKTGLHTIEVAEFGNNATVGYSLTVERIASPSPTARQMQYGQTLNDGISPVVDIDPFFFAGTAGDTVSLSVSKLNGTGNPLVQLFAPDGTNIGQGLNPFQVVLQQTGPHSILVTEFVNDNTVDYALTLQCISGACLVTPIPDVSGCLDLQGSPLAGRKVDLLQNNETTQTTKTDARGCYTFENTASGKTFQVIIRGPVVP